MGIFDELGEVAESVAEGIDAAAGDLAEATADMFEGGTLLAGIVVAGGAFAIVGPGYAIPAFLVGSNASRPLIRQHQLEPGERAFIESVIGTGNLMANEEIVLTNLSGLAGRKFVVPNGPQILVNLGDAYEKPMARSKLFVHEMVHVMQHHRAEFRPGLVCEGAFNQIVGGGNYDPGPGGLPWHRYNIEQQATIVDEWFAPSARFGAFTPAQAPAHPFWPYVRDDVRRVDISRHEAYGLNFVLPHSTPAGANQQDTWRYCGKCRALFYDGDPDKRGCPAGGPHAASGYNFVLPHSVGEGPGAQKEWRFCDKCHAMFYQGHPTFNGACANGRQHVADGFEFVLPYQAPAGPQEQDAWRYCGKCRSLFYDGDPANKGRCCAGGAHSAHGHTFILEHSVPAGENLQNAWRYCGKCRSLFYDGDPANKGTCPAGWGHGAHGFDFALTHHVGSQPNRQTSWRYCGKCRSLFYAATQSQAGACPTGGAHGAYGLNFSLRHQAVPDASAQDQWRFCAKCHVMFYGADQANLGVCAAV